MKRRLAWLLTGALLAALLTACGAATRDGAAPSAADASGFAPPAGNGAGWEEALTAPADAEEGMVSHGGAAGVPGALSQAAGSGLETDALRDAKLIRTGTLELETTAFDQAVQALDALVTEHGGYLESGSLSNRGGGYRSADYTVRVPAERYKRFFAQAGELCHLLERQEYQENITTAYYDTAGRLKTQQTKLERLQTLLARAESMEDIITIESAISETEQVIESLSGELRHYDALVDYATVYISLREVYKLSGTEEPAVSFPGRLGAAFASGWRAFINVLESLAVAVAYGWMWLLPLAVIATAVFRRARRRNRAEAPGERRATLWPPRCKKTDDKGPEG